MKRRVIKADSDSFEREVLHSNRPVLVDFWAPWCRPCRLVSPTLKQLAEEFAGQVKVVKVNADENPSLMQRFGVRGLPTVILFDGGQMVRSTLGVRSKSAYRALLERRLSVPLLRPDVRLSEPTSG